MLRLQSLLIHRIGLGCLGNPGPTLDELVEASHRSLHDKPSAHHPDINEQAEAKRHRRTSLQSQRHEPHLNATNQPLRCTRHLGVLLPLKLARGLDAPLKLDTLQQLYGKKQIGEYEVSCDLKDVKLQYRNVIVIVGVPTHGVKVRTWSGDGKQPKARAVLVVGDLKDNTKTAQVVYWANLEELQRLKERVDLAGGKCVMLVNPRYRHANDYR
ncbi:hypothetical protein WJX74_001786 [Apatococcus lobatus]|uniref:Uncharacterized protein n=1 Tax=Apatococcus lobatus TaxID=904363 RepID=A0AAW1RKF8_9CHLO